MTALMINIVLVGLMVVVAVLILRTHRLFAAIVFVAAYSLLSAAMFVNLDAVDVAFTEAAVGAGISTVLLLAAMARLPAEEKPRGFALLPFMICVVAGVILVAAVLELAAFGDIFAPPHIHVAPRYLAESENLLHIPNVVTTVLASYRGFDTLGETIVVFVAGLGVFILLAPPPLSKTPSIKTPLSKSRVSKNRGGAKKKRRADNA